MNMMKHLTIEEFDDAIESGVSLVDFWADWCGPCRMVAPIIEELGETYDGRALIAKVNVDEQAELSSRFAVMSIPTVIIFKDGEEQGRLVGVSPQDEYVRLLEEAM